MFLIMTKPHRAAEDAVELGLIRLKKFWFLQSKSYAMDRYRMVFWICIATRGVRCR